MPGKSKTEQYQDFTVLVEHMRKRKVRVRKQFVPSLCAYLLAVGQQFEKARDALEDKWAKDEAAAGAAVYYETACRVIQHLIKLTDQHLPVDAWDTAVQEVAKAFGITDAITTPIELLPFSKLNLPTVEHALPQQDGGTGVLEPSASDGEAERDRDQRSDKGQELGGRERRGRSNAPKAKGRQQRKPTRNR